MGASKEPLGDLSASNELREESVDAFLFSNSINVSVNLSLSLSA